MRNSNDQQPRRGSPPRALTITRTGAIITVALITGAATVFAIIESYGGLHEWAMRHGEPGGWGKIWPLLIDSPIIAGEILLFVAFVDRWQWERKILPWALIIAGLAASVAANFNHLHAASLPARATSAAAPLVACVMLASTLFVLKWTASRSRESRAQMSTLSQPAGRTVKPAARRRAPSVPSAREEDHEIIGRLRAMITAGSPLPSIRSVARDELGNVNRHRRAKALLLAAQNGDASGH